MVENLKRMGIPYGIEFADLKLLSNSRMAMEAGEFVKRQGRWILTMKRYSTPISQKVRT